MSNRVCEICGCQDNKIIYEGYVRNGSFGNMSSESTKVFECLSCAVQRLEETACYSDEIYESEVYRSILKEGLDSDSFFSEHDKLQLERLRLIEPSILRNKVVADIGCAAGSFLDHISGLTRDVIAVEPCQAYHQSLLKRGYQVYNSCESLAGAKHLNVDYFFSFSVIEHVLSPLEFLQAISRVMNPSSTLIISTPNRNDLLMKILPKDYQKFFYRRVHRWYFDEISLEKCANLAGLKVIKSKCVHRFGLANTLLWLRDRKPSGQVALARIDEHLDQAWKNNLENNGLGDYLYLWLEKRN